MKLMIPKTERLDPSVSEELISFFVFGPLVWKTMPAAVQFNREFCDRAVKVEEVNTARILAAEFEFGKAAVAQQTPQAFFSISGFLSQVACKIAGGNGPGAVLADLRCWPPHPIPLPRWGRGRLQRRAVVICGLQMRPTILGLVEDQRGRIGIGLAHLFTLPSNMGMSLVLKSSFIAHAKLFGALDQRRHE